MRTAFRLMLLALVATPTFFAGQKKDDILEIQRDVAAVDEKVRHIQAAQTEQDKKIEELRQMLQQSASASAQLTQDMAALQKSLTAALSAAMVDQQGKMSQAVAPLGSRIDGVSTGVDQLNTSFQALNDRIGRLESKIKNIDDKVSLINQPPPALPTPVSVVPEPPANGAPAGVTRPGLQEDAQRDYQSGNDELAMKELTNYVKWFPMDAWAPTAGYTIGQLYMRGKDYESATEAFQSVIDNYPGNNQAQNALYQKGMAYAAWPGHKADALRTLNDFINMYGVNDNVPNAKAELKKLTTPSASQQKGKGGRGAAKQ